MQVEVLQTILCFTFGSCAFSFNLLLAFIILTVKCVYIGKYKWLLFLYTLSAMFCGISQLITAPHMFLHPNGFIFYDGLQLLPSYIGDYVLVIYSFCIFQSMMILTHSFIYRYYAVCDPEKLAHFVKNWPKITIISVGTQVAGIVALAYVAHRSPLYEDLVNDAFINTTGFSLAETGYIGCIVFTKAGLNLNLVAVVSAFLIFSISVGGIMVKLAVKIAKTLRNSSLSGIVAIHQKRIFILLLYQLVLPLVFSVCPQEFIILSAYFHIDTHQIVQMLCCCFTVGAVIDPLVTFYLIKPYRTALLENIHLVKTNNIRNVFSTTVVPLS